VEDKQIVTLLLQHIYLNRIIIKGRMEFIEAKTILQKATHGEVDYNMNLYKGCCHKYIYCDSRSNCYQVENFDRVRAKKDEVEILNKELRNKRKKGVIGIGAISDTYNPFEKQYEITRKALELISYYKFGVSIETKSNYIKRKSKRVFF